MIRVQIWFEIICIYSIYMIKKWYSNKYENTYIIQVLTKIIHLWLLELFSTNLIIIECYILGLSKYSFLFIY